MLADQLSHMDSAFLSLESPATPMHTAGVVIFDGKVPFHQIYALIDERLHLVPRFTQRVAGVPMGLGRPFWVPDPNFELSYHLRHGALPPPGDDDQLCAYAARLISRPLDRSRPLWELYVVEGLEHDRSALVAKTHHAMVDGMSSMDLATAIFDFTEDPQRTEPGRIERPSRMPSSAELVAAALRRHVEDVGGAGSTVSAAIRAPQKLAEVAVSAASAAAGAATSMVRLAPSSPLNTSGPGLQRRFAIVRSTLQTFKDIKNVAEATVNDVVLAVCADALGRLLRARGEPTEGSSLKAMVPVSVRSEEQRGALGNEITAVFPELPIGKMPPLDRLSLVHDQLAGIKESRKAVGADLLVGLTKWAPPTLHSMAARAATRARLMNVVISNVPGPQVPLYSCGVKMMEPYAVIPLSRGQSLSIGVTSYLGGIFFGLNADRDAHPDLDQLARYVEESIGELAKGASEGTSEAVTPAETEIAVGSEED